MHLDLVRRRALQATTSDDQSCVSRYWVTSVTTRLVLYRFHAHHELTIAGTPVSLSDGRCLETAVMSGSPIDSRSLPTVSAPRGVYATPVLTAFERSGRSRELSRG